jgi:hypothetical protein
MWPDVAFSQGVVDAAVAVMRCEYCCSHVPNGDRPQPGWVGDCYTAGRGVVVLLQNPGVSPADRGNEREAQGQRLLREFTEHPSIDTYTELMRFMFRDMGGQNGGPPWAKWTHPVSKLIPDRRRLAWMNVVKFRTPGQSRKDGPVTPEAVEHGIARHLQRELTVLQPKAVVSLGTEARKALSMIQLPPAMMTCHLKLQGASDREVRTLRQLLIQAGADV